MRAEELLSRLDGVKQAGPGRWMAKSPAFPNQRTGSLSIRETEDGRILLHDFAGADVHSIVALLGIQIGDLFPESRLTDKALKPVRQAHSALAALKTLQVELLIVCMAADAMLRGASPVDSDLDRLTLAASRLRDALEVCK
jgi:hypothetical protein